VRTLHAWKEQGKSRKRLGPVESFEEFVKDLKTELIDDEYEIVCIFGDCIWNIFSNNHTVFNENGESYHLGSWRGSAGFIADVIYNLQHVEDKSFDYIDFYMGGIFSHERAELAPVYEFIFKKLKAKNLDWEYLFPRMGLISFNKDEDEKDDIVNYSPEEAVEKQLEKEQQQNET